MIWWQFMTIWCSIWIKTFIGSASVQFQYTLFYFKANMLHDFLMFWSSTSLQRYFLWIYSCFISKVSLCSSSGLSKYYLLLLCWEFCVDRRRKHATVWTMWRTKLIKGTKFLKQTKTFKSSYFWCKFLIMYNISAKVWKKIGKE